jgi:hypothetical protein
VFTSDTNASATTCVSVSPKRKNAASARVLIVTAPFDRPLMNSSRLTDTYFARWINVIRRATSSGARFRIVIFAPKMNSRSAELIARGGHSFALTVRCRRRLRPAS